MQNPEHQLKDLLQSTLEMSQKALKLVQEQKIDELNSILLNRERAINIIMSLYENLQLQERTAEFLAFEKEVQRIIDQICHYDTIISECLQYQKKITQSEIASTFKNNQSLKGYNLNNLK